jgi:hypothetical protein
MFHDELIRDDEREKFHDAFGWLADAWRKCSGRLTKTGGMSTLFP